MNLGLKGRAVLRVLLTPITDMKHYENPLQLQQGSNRGNTLFFIVDTLCLCLRSKSCS